MRNLLRSSKAKCDECRGQPYFRVRTNEGMVYLCKVHAAGRWDVKDPETLPNAPQIV